MSKARNLATFGSTKSGHISGDSATFTDTVTASEFMGSIASGSTSGYYIGNDSNGLEAYLHTIEAVGSTIRLKSGGNTILSHNEAEDGIYLRTNDANRLSVSSVGNIGIGTANANSLLHVYNDVDSAEQIIIAETFGDYSRGTGISFRLDDTEMGRVNAHETRGMTFYVTDSVGNAATERMRIDTSGNVGIGTASPSGALTVKRDININADSNLGDRIAPLVVGSDPDDSAVAAILIDGNQIEQALETDRLYLNFNSSSHLCLNFGGGNVGIGVATPSKDLELAMLKTQRWQTGSTTLDLTPTSGATDQFVFNTSQDALIDFKMAGTTKASITTNGITFNGDTAAANALDDYEEGTWTPAISSGATVNSYTTQNAVYVKIGRLVHIRFLLEGDITATGGVLYLSGLPFNYPSGTLGYSWLACGQFGGNLVSSTDGLAIQATNNLIRSTNLRTSVNSSTTATIEGAGSYYTDA